MKRRLLLLACVALIARLFFCFVLFPRIAARTTVGELPYFDSYREIAASLVSGDGYRLPSGKPAMHRPPGYTVLIALCDPTDPARCHIWFKLLHALLGALATIVTFAAAREWGVGVRGATCAALVVALWPFTVWETKVTVPENLLVLLIPLAFLGLKRSAALAGAAAAWSALTHGVYPVLALFVVLMLIVMKRFRAAAIAAIVIAIPLACWTARNAHLGFRGLATGYGYHYFRGLYDYQQHDLRDHNIEEQDYVSQITVAAGLPSMATDDARSDPTVNKWLDRKATEHLLAHPGLTIVKTLTNMPKAWIRQQTTARSVANALLLLPLLILAAIGLRRDRD